MRIENVTKRYGEKVVLDNISLSLETGKITAILGESGTGKTTLLNILSGLTDFEGAVEGRGTVSYLFQSPRLLPNLTVEGNLKFVLPKSEWGRIGEMLDRVGLGGRGKSLPKSLSGGERQRVAIARAFLYPHDLLLMDEPFSSIDLSLKNGLLQLVSHLSEAQKDTVVFVTHDVHEAAILSHRALVLRSGKFIGDFANDAPFPRDFFAHYPLEETLIRTLCAPKEQNPQI